jgi:hypothetical protein
MHHYVQLFQRPPYQALFFLLLTVLVYAIIRPVEADRVWVISGVLYVAFIVINSIFLWPAERAWAYFFYSLGISILYLLISATLVNGYLNLFKVEGSGESGMIFLVIIYHPFTLLFVMFLKWLFTKLY